MTWIAVVVKFARGAVKNVGKGNVSPGTGDGWEVSGSAWELLEFSVDWALLEAFVT